VECLSTRIRHLADLKKLLIFFIFVSTSSILFGQPINSLSIGPDLALPANNFGANATLGIGGSVEYQAISRGRIAAHVHAGYVHFSNKVVPDEDISFVPIRIGIAGFIHKDVFFVSADVGVSYASSSTGTKQLGFSVGVGPGYKFYLSAEKKHFLQCSACYNLHNSIGQSSGGFYGWFCLRLSYGFSFQTLVASD